MKTRTMVYLDATQLRALRTEAKARGISLAELFRQLVQGHLEGHQEKTPVSPEAFRRIVGLGSSGHKDISEQHDTRFAEALRHEHAG
jgi:hypothetical protein